MTNKLSKLLEILDLIEDDKARTGSFIDSRVINKFQELPDWKEIATKWTKKSSEASDEETRLTFANMALGYIPKVLKPLKDKWDEEHKGEKGERNPFSTSARLLARDALKKERANKVSSEHDMYKEKEDGDEASGFGQVAGKSSVSIERKEAVSNLIAAAKKKFGSDEDAMKSLGINLVFFGFDEIIPPASIPHYSDISSLIRKVEAEGERKKSAAGKLLRGRATPTALALEKPPYGLGVPQRTYYKVIGFLKDRVKGIQHNESFMTGLQALFGGEKTASGKPSKEFKLSNLEPMEDVIKRDISNYKFKNYGLHLQGVTKEEGEDMLKEVPSIKHQYQGDALLIPLDAKAKLKTILKKAIPGKKVILFGFDTQPKPLRKGWEGFPYKLVTNPTVVGSYSLSPESKSESLLKMISEGFQCNHYDHSKLACGYAERPCGWKGFPSIGEDMRRECSDYRGSA